MNLDDVHKKLYQCLMSIINENYGDLESLKNFSESGWNYFF